MQNQAGDAGGALNTAWQDALATLAQVAVASNAGGVHGPAQAQPGATSTQQHFQALAAPYLQQQPNSVQQDAIYRAALAAAQQWLAPQAFTLPGSAPGAAQQWPPAPQQWASAPRQQQHSMPTQQRSPPVTQQHSVPSAPLQQQSAPLSQQPSRATGSGSGVQQARPFSMGLAERERPPGDAHVKPTQRPRQGLLNVTGGAPSAAMAFLKALPAARARPAPKPAPPAGSGEPKSAGAGAPAKVPPGKRAVREGDPGTSGGPNAGRKAPAAEAGADGGLKPKKRTSSMTVGQMVALGLLRDGDLLRYIKARTSLGQERLHSCHRKTLLC